MTSKEIVYNTLSGKNKGRTARQLWYLPWAEMYHCEELTNIRTSFPSDILNIGAALKEKAATSGDPHEIGTYTDEWGCVYLNRHRGIIGEVKQPLVIGEEWEDADRVHIPEEWLSFDTDKVNGDIAKNVPDKFILSGHCPRPFERLQFIRGTENLYIDLMLQPAGFLAFKEKLHDFYCRLLKKWAQTDVDGLMIMDDWGSQSALLINPVIWEQLFAPMYRDYIEIAHKAGKKIFMHSDGYTLDIIPRLIDLGLDAINAQLFCMNIDDLKQYRGKITFWGEIDRQRLLPNGTPQDIRNAVKLVYDNLYDNGHCIAQCEFGPGANPANVYEVFHEWDVLTKK
ncbi:MAG: methyltransferase [Clostridiales bacterium]|jgi:hypothetical protein|nr:methyltransferase [Clostridiales bacterium]